jgi:outer membrane protein OmpA-like peptidoglycan-associated protein
MEIFMNTRSMLLAASILAVPALAAAQPVNGLYIGGGLGINYMQQLKASATPAASSGKWNTRLGPIVVGSVGWGFGNGLRAELEGNFRDNGLHSNSPAGGGNMRTYGVMVNALYDFDLGASWIYPYVGAGVGYERENLNGAHIGTVSLKDSSKGGLGVQGILGAAFPISSAPGLSVTAEYRFMDVLNDPTYGGTGGTVKINDALHHSLLIGVRYAFNTAAPPPPPAPAPAAAPAPAPARTYLVFFDWDKSDLTARARSIIAEAAQASTHVSTTRIEANGYTDLSGTAAYNQGLSERRANAVAAELVRDGVPKNIIFVQGFGETHPLVPTAPGVREPQNRRVEIILK